MPIEPGYFFLPQPTSRMRGLVLVRMIGRAWVVCVDCALISCGLRSTSSVSIRPRCRELRVPPFHIVARLRRDGWSALATYRDNGGGRTGLWIWAIFYRARYSVPGIRLRASDGPGAASRDPSCAGEKSLRDAGRGRPPGNN